MLNKTILSPVTQAGAERKTLSVEKPQTQTVEAVKALLSWRGRASDPLPEFVEMGEGDGRLVLVLSNKKDAYYTVTARDCSCPAHNWHPNQCCKHQRKHFPEQQTITRQSMAETLRQADENLHKMPYQYRRMVQAARDEAEADALLELDPDRKPFRPFIEDEARPLRGVA
jgi:hypothetical protein